MASSINSWPTFAKLAGPVFDAIFQHVVDPPPTPVADHADAFVEWTARHLLDAINLYTAYPGATAKEIKALASAADVTGVGSSVATGVERLSMLFLTRWFGITGSDAERNLAREKSEIEEIAEKTLLAQRNAADQQHRPLCCGTHAKGICVRAEFEVLDVAGGRDPVLAVRFAKGIFREPGAYPAIVRFGNADPKTNSDFKPDVRALSFSVDLTRDGTAARGATVGRQDFSLQNTKTLRISDATAFLATMKRLTASNPAVGLVVSTIQ